MPKRTSSSARRTTASNTPLRTCVGCRRRSETQALIRIAAPSLRVGRTEPGRGAWLCAGSATCFDEAIRRGSLARALRRPVSTDEAEHLRATLVGRTA